jgi:hypothetical protein
VTHATILAVSGTCSKATDADRFPPAFKRFRRLDASGG